MAVPGVCRWHTWIMWQARLNGQAAGADMPSFAVVVGLVGQGEDGARRQGMSCSRGIGRDWARSAVAWARGQRATAEAVNRVLERRKAKGKAQCSESGVYTFESGFECLMSVISEVNHAVRVYCC